MTNEDIGYNQFFEEGRIKLGFNDSSVARITSESKGAYRIRNANGEFLARITGKQMFSASGREDFPAVGDWVAISELDTERAVIQGILPRKTIIKRKSGDKNRAGEKNDTQVIATNIDVAFVVESVDRDYNLNRFERYFTIAESGGAESAIILNKIDLLSSDELAEKIIELKHRFKNIDIIQTSTFQNKGLEDLKQYIKKNKTYCFLGSSGVGKSSLINKLLGEESIKTGDISTYSGRGKHVTTSRQMYFLKNGGIVIDNPGMREVGMADSGAGIDALFDEVAALATQCKYTNCTHTCEPGCGVIKAVHSGALDKEKYSNYINLKKESEFYELNDFEKRKKDREFGKFIKTAKKEIKKSGYKD